MPVPKPVMFVVLDGWGWREEVADNAVRQANTPCFDRLWAAGPRAFLHTSGHDVGLPDGQMGNSEVGHLNLGAGRVVMQDLPRIDTAVADGSLATIPQVQALIGQLKASGGTLHLMGLLSGGGVHSHQRHGLALAKIFAAAGIPVAIHAWTDGRDTGPDTSLGFLAQFEPALTPQARIATVYGRYFAMDRDNRWERVKQAWDAMVRAEGQHAATAAAAITAAHAAGKTDEFIPAAVIGDYAGMKDGDALLCFNFRADRVRQVLAALLDPAFTGFDRGDGKGLAGSAGMPKLVGAAGMTQYSTALDPFLTTLFAPQSMQDILGEVVSRAGKTQLRMAETEKYPHVTYFFNGGEETPYPGEDRTMAPSPKVATYDLQPEMSAAELTAKAVEAIDSGRYDLVILNFANTDMVGHTGVLAAAIKAAETVDAGLGAIAAAVQRQSGALLVTADHGNAELMVDPVTGKPHTAHTTNPVPLMLIGGQAAGLADGRLADIAPTLLALMGLAQPAEMTGQSLLR